MCHTFICNTVHNLWLGGLNIFTTKAFLRQLHFLSLLSAFTLSTRLTCLLQLGAERQLPTRATAALITSMGRYDHFVSAFKESAHRHRN